MQTVGISMIVRNAERTVARALAPFRGRISEIVAVDTGSTDGTIRELEKLGARIETFAWNDDFSEARNAALDAATTDWIFAIDADEWVEPGVPDMIRSVAQRDDVDACMVETINFVAKQEDGTLPTEGSDASIAPAYVLSTKIRLSRKGPRWEGAVHELLDFDARRRNFRIALAPFRIRHDGMMKGGESSYYVELCRKSYRTGNIHPGILFVLGLEAIRSDDNAAAEKFWRESIALEPAFVRGYAGLARLLHLTGRSNEGVAILDEGLVNCSRSTEIGQLYAAAVGVHSDRGDLHAIAKILEKATLICPGDPYVAEAAKTADAKSQSRR